MRSPGAMDRSRGRVADNLELIENRPPSVAKLFWDRVAATPDIEAFRKPTADGWSSYSWREVGDRVRELAAGLLSLGIRQEDPGRVDLRRPRDHVFRRSDHDGVSDHPAQ